MAAGCPELLAQQPSVILPQRHVGRIGQVVIAADQKWFATAGDDGTVRLWSLPDGVHLRTLSAPGVTTLALSPDEGRIAVGDEDGTLKFINVATGRVEHEQALGDRITGVGWSRDGRSIAAATSSRLVMVESASGKERGQLDLRAGEQIQFAVTGERLFLMAEPRGLITKRLYSVDVKEWSSPVEVSQAEVTSYAVSADGEQLALTGRNGALTLLSSTGAPLAGPAAGGSSTAAVAGLSFVDAGLLLVLHADGTAQLLHVGSRAVVKRVQTAARNLTSVAAASAHRLAVAVTFSGSIVLIPATLDGETREIAPASVAVHRTAIIDNELFILGANGEFGFDPLLGSALAWRVGQAIQPKQLYGAPVALLPTFRKQRGTWAVVTDKDSVEFTNIGRAAAGAETEFRVDVEEAIQSISNDGEWISWVADNGGRPSVIVKELEGQRKRRFDLPAEKFFTAHLVPNTTIVAVAGSSDGSLRFWDYVSGREFRTFAPRIELPGVVFLMTEVDALAFSLDGRVAVAHPDKRIRIWKIREGALERTLSPQHGGARALAFNTAGTRLMVGCADGTLSTIDLSSPDAKAEQTVSILPLRHVAFLPGESRALATDSEGILTVVDLEAREPLVSMQLQSGDGHWIAVTPAGLLDGTDASWRQIRWRTSERTFDVAPLETFFTELFHPGLMHLAVSGKKLPASPQVSANTVAKVVLRADATGEITDRNLTLRVSVEGAGLRDVRLFRNGSLLRRWSGEQSGVLETTVAVRAGANAFTAYAFNQRGGRTEEATLEVTGAESLRRPGALHVVAVGVNAYGNPSIDLRYAAADARSLVAMLTNGRRDIQSFYETLARNFEATRNLAAATPDALRRERERVVRYGGSAGSSHTRVLLDGQATRTAVLSAIQATVKEVQPEDSFILFFAGHGIADGNRYYLLPADLGYAGSLAALGSEGLAAVRSNGISDQDLETALEGLDASATALIIDACESGQITATGTDWRRGPINSSGLAQLAYEKNLDLLAAAQSYQTAKEVNKFGHGLLTYAFALEAIGKGQGAIDSLSDGIELRHALDYAARRVPELDGDVAGVRGPKRVQGPAIGGVQRPSLTKRRVEETVPTLVGIGAISLDPLTMEDPSASRPAVVAAPADPKTPLLYSANTPGSIAAAAIATDGSWIVTADRTTDEVHVWRLPDLLRAKTIPVNVTPAAVALHPDGRQLGYLSDNSNILIVDLALGTHRQLSPLLKRAGETIQWTADGSQLIVPGDDLAVLIDVAEGKPVRRFNHRGVTHAYLFDEQRSLVTVRPYSGDIIVWDFASGKQRHTIAGPAETREIAIDSGKGRLAMATEKRVVVVDLSTRQAISEFETAAETPGLAFSSDGTTLFVGMKSGRVVPYAPESGRPRAPFTSSAAYIGGIVTAKDALVGFGLDHLLVSWMVPEVTPRAEVIRRAFVTALAMAPDGSLSVSGTTERDVVAARLSTTFENRTVAHGDPDRFRTSGGFTVTGNGKTLQLWSAAKAEPTVVNGDRPWDSVAVSPDGTRVASCAARSNDSVEIVTWDVAGGRKRLIATVRTKEARRGCGFVWISRDGRWIAHGYGGLLRVYASQTGSVALTVAAEADSLESIDHVAFTDDGGVIAVAKSSGTVVHRLPDGQLIRRLRLPLSGWARVLAISPDGRWLAAGDSAGGVSLTDLTGTDRIPLKRMPAEVRTLQFARGMLLALSEDGTVHAYSATDGAFIARLVWAVGTSDWIVIAADGSFDTSPGWRRRVFVARSGPSIADVENVGDERRVDGLWQQIVNRSGGR